MCLTECYLRDEGTPTDLTPPPPTTHTVESAATKQSNRGSSVSSRPRVRGRRLPGCLLYDRPWLLIGQLRMRGSNQPSVSGARAGTDQLLFSCSEKQGEEKREGGKEKQSATCLARNSLAEVILWIIWYKDDCSTSTAIFCCVSPRLLHFQAALNNLQVECSILYPVNIT